MKDVISHYADRDGEIIFEYDIPRLGKRLDVVMLFEGIVFCLEFKVDKYGQEALEKTITDAISVLK